MCHRPHGGASPEGAAPEVVLSIVDGSELAQYVDQEGSAANVVYVVARAAFSRPPANFTAQDVAITNGELDLQHTYIPCCPSSPSVLCCAVLALGHSLGCGMGSHTLCSRDVK